VKNKAMQDGDAAVLGQIYGDNLIFVDTSGRVLTKEDRMRSFEKGNLKYISFDQGDYNVHLYGDTAVIDGASCSVVNNHGRMITKPRRFTTVYVKLGGRWRYVAHQATIVSETKDFPKCER
jgi:ketosteroid isomerase-like protein